MSAEPESVFEAMLNALCMALPYVEDTERLHASDFKPGVIAAQIRKLRSVIARGELELARLKDLDDSQNVTRVVVVIRGGNVESVYSSSRHVSVDVIDFDNAECEDNEDDRDEDCTRSQDAAERDAEEAARTMHQIICSFARWERVS